MKQHKRNSTTIYIEDMAYTFMKPLSEEHAHELIVLYEDAYGDMHCRYADIPSLKGRFNLIDEEIQEILIDLNKKFYSDENIR
jgi:hypothetical protein